jgi:predicted O-methyltransferase YrrM
MTFPFAQWLRRPTQPNPAIESDNANLAVVLPWALARAADDLLFPSAYVEFIRSCLEMRTLAIKTIKQRRGGAQASHRFNTLLSVLTNPPPLAFPVADRLARVAQHFQHNTGPLISAQWHGDVRAHFEISSSFGHKGRILAAILRFMRTRQVLELGTAYGMSAMFMLETMGQDGRLTTVEGREVQHGIASTVLTARYPGRVVCELGLTSEILPRLCKELPPVDFLFHDAGHSRKAFIDDFHAALPLFAPGAVVLVDDIFWNDPRFAKRNPRCHQGWLKVATHPRVVQAVEISREMGLLLLS